MIVQDVVTRVRRTFGDDAAVQVTDDDVMRWINDSQIEIVKNNEDALQTTAFMNLVAGTSTYTLPADLMILRSLRFKYPNDPSFSRLKYKSMQQFDESVDGWDGSLFSSSTPQFFTKYAGAISLFPTPDTSSTSGLKLLYNQRPTDVTLLSSALALPLIYHNTIVKYCLWQASQLDDDNEPALMYKSHFQEDVDQLANNADVDPTDTYPVITTLEYDR